MSDFCIKLKSDASSTHSFVYKEKLYPFNMTIFRIFSQYYQKYGIPHKKEIKLVEDSEKYNFELKESAINDFIQYCQNQLVEITADNFITVHKLATKYIVPSLIQATEEFLCRHQDEYIDKYLSTPEAQQDEISIVVEENLSNNLAKYLDDDRLLNLPIINLQRIVKKQADAKVADRSKLIQFLFKSLDKYGIEGSVLFSDFDFGSDNLEVVRRLLNSYKDKFDFANLNNVHTHIIYCMENEHRQIREQFENKMMESEIVQKNLKNESRILIDHMKQMEAKFNDSLLMIREEIEKVRYENVKLKEKLCQLAKTNQETKEQLNQLAKINLETKEQPNQLAKTNQETKEQPTGFMFSNTQIHKQKKSQKVILRCSDSDNPRGILSKLSESVKLSCKGDISQYYPLSNILKDDNQVFQNYNTDTKCTEDCACIIFDFGPSMQVHLESYLLTTGSFCYHPFEYVYPKSWIIEGSNDNEQWIPIDRQTNGLNGANLKQHKYCSSMEPMILERFRYIRYRQNSTWNEDQPYAINLRYFELYGEVYDNK